MGKKIRVKRDEVDSGRGNFKDAEFEGYRMTRSEASSKASNMTSASKQMA